MCVCVWFVFYVILCTSFEVDKQLNKANICLCRHQFHFFFLWIYIVSCCQFASWFRYSFTSRRNLRVIAVISYTHTHAWMNREKNDWNKASIQLDDKIMTNKPQSLFYASSIDRILLVVFLLFLHRWISCLFFPSVCFFNMIESCRWLLFICDLFRFMIWFYEMALNEHTTVWQCTPIYGYLHFWIDKWLLIAHQRSYTLFSSITFKTN